MKFLADALFILITAVCVIFYETHGSAIAQSPAVEVSKIDFSEEIIEILQTVDPDVAYIYTSEDGVIKPDTTNGDKKGQHIYIGNLYNIAKYMAAPERSAYVQTFFDESQEKAPIDLEAFKTSLSLRLRTQAELSNRKYYMSDIPIEAKASLIENIGDLRLELIEDHENTMKLVFQKDLGERNLPKAEAFKIAHKNLDKTRKKKTWTKLAKHIWMSKIEDDFDAVRLVTGGTKPKLPFKGTPTMFIPSHSICLITDSENPDILDQMIQSGIEMAEEQRPLSQAIWRKKNGRWQVWTPDFRHPAYEVIAVQNIRDKLGDYQEQTNLMDEANEDEGVEIFVANLIAYQDGKRVITRAILPIGETTLLPKSDYIVFYDPKIEGDEDRIGELSWQTFSQIIGEKNMQPLPDTFPPRYDFNALLTPEILARIRQRAIKK